MRLIILFLLAIGAFCQANNAYVEMAPYDYVNNPLITTLRDFGAKFVVNKAVQDGKIASTSYTLTRVHHVFNQTAPTYINYKYDLSLKVNKNDTLNTIFNVRYNLTSKASVVTSYSYNISYGAINNSTNNTGFIPINPAQYSSALIQSLVNFGKNSVYNKAVAAGKIPAGNYTVTKINSVSKQNVTGGANYKFNINFKNTIGTREVVADFIINYKTATKAMLVTASSYVVVPFSTK